jgi:hypothetical protein
MGDVVTQNWAYTNKVLLALIKMFEQEWQTFYLAMPLPSICACMFFVSSLGGKRGFEVVWTDLAALRYNVSYCELAEDKTAVSWPVVGRFKARHGVLDCYMIPIARVTSSGIQFFTWTRRFIRQLKWEGFKDGWVFRREYGSSAKASDYQDSIFCKLEIIQATTTLINPGCSVWDEYSIQRSERQFFTTRCTNMKVDKHNIKLQCWWSTDRVNDMRTVQQSMIHNYLEVRNMKQALIRPSKACQAWHHHQGFSPTWAVCHECWAFKSMQDEKWWR